jgi:hypothetical protein
VKLSLFVMLYFYRMLPLNILFNGDKQKTKRKAKQIFSCFSGG